MIRLITLAALTVCAVFPASADLLNALVVDGQNNHKWMQTTPELVRILLESGRFTTEVATAPPSAEGMENFSPDFSQYDVIVLNYNGTPWNETTKKNFVDYVSNGGAVAVVHAANNSFADWPEYNEMIGFGGWGGRSRDAGPYIYWENGELVYNAELDGPAGAHEGYGDFTVTNRDPDHPILEGMPNEWFQRDELYNYMRGPRKKHAPSGHRLLRCTFQ